MGGGAEGRREGTSGGVDGGGTGIGGADTTDDHQGGGGGGVGGFLIQVPKNIRYVVLRRRTIESPEEDSPPKSPVCDSHHRPPSQLHKSVFANSDHPTSPSRSPSSAADESGHHGIRSPPIDIPNGNRSPRKQPPHSFFSSDWASRRLTDSPAAPCAQSLPGCRAGVSEPCRIVVESEDSPVDAADGDARRNSSSSMGESCGSRRGSVSPRDQLSSGPAVGGVPSFLWSLGVTSSSAPSPGNEDQFWVPENILQKRRANSMVSPAFLSTSSAEFGGGIFLSSVSVRRLSISVFPLLFLPAYSLSSILIVFLFSFLLLRLSLLPYLLMFFKHCISLSM